MSFSNPALLLGLLAAGIPVLIHLLNKRRHKTVQWAAMQFLLKATQESRGKKKLRHIVILTMRTLAVAALIFAIARPLVSGLMGFSGGQVKTVVFLLDRSVSMEANEEGSDKSKRQAAIDRIVESMESLSGARLILIDSASLVPQEVPNPAQLAELTATQPTSAAANVPAMLEVAAAYLGGTDTGRTEIWLASDQQRSSWAPEDGRWATVKTTLSELPGKPKLRILSFEGQPEANLAVAIPSVRRTGDTLAVDILLTRREDTAPVEVPLTINLDGASLAETVVVQGQSLRFTKTLSLAGRSGGGSGWVEITSDSNVQDNSAYFTYGEDVTINTAIIAEDPAIASVLELMAAPPSFGNFAATVTSPATAGNADLTSASAVVWQGALPTDATAQKLESFVRSGGQLLLLPPRNDSDATFLDFSWGALLPAPQDQYFIPADWERRDGPLRDSDTSGGSLPVDKLRAVQRRALPAEDLTTLAKLDTGEALAARRVLDAGEIVALSTLPDYAWSNLADGSILLPALHRMIAAGTLRLGGTHSTAAGTTRAAALPGEAVTRLDSQTTSTEDPAGYRAGLYTFGERTVAITRPPAEDDWELLSENASREVLRGLDSTYSQQSTDDEGTLAREIWRAFLIAALIFLITEAILCLPAKSENKGLKGQETTA